MKTFKVRTADGAIMGSTALAKLPATAQGLELHDGDATVAAATHWWDGKAFAKRADRGTTTLQLTTGTAQAISIPVDGWTSLDGEPPVKGPRTITPATSGTMTLTFSGKYAGSIVLVSQTMAEMRADLLAQIDAAAGEARRKWLTMVPGQADAYREKMVDVASLNGLGGTTAPILAALNLLTPAQQKARWPFLYAEMQARGLTNLIQARDAIQSAADASRAARGEIERIRRAGKIAVQNATTVTAAKTAAAAVVFPA